MRLTMSLANNQTHVLWKAFRSKANTVKNRVSDDFISMQVYSPSYFEVFKPASPFEKWASVEVDHLNQIPEDMEGFELEAGLYAVFHYKGSSSDPSIYQYIFAQWLPKSIYELDNRPHFEVLGDKYKNNDPNSEEHIWIPIKEK